MKIATCTKRPVLNPCGLESFDYQIEPYIGCEHLCYYCYVLNQAETDWTEKILVHEDIVAQLSKELNGIPSQRIYMGYYSDPYQPCESVYLQTREILKLLRSKGFSASILTKSDLVVRDMDLLRAMAAPSVSVSVAFDDHLARSRFEARTIDTESRINALEQLKAAGIKTGALVCPVIPYISEVSLLIDQLASCTDEIWIYGLSIIDRKDRNWLNIESILEKYYPDLKEKIETVVFSKNHPFWRQLRNDLITLREERQLNLNIHV